MTIIPGLPTITVKGPFWSAEVDLVNVITPPTPVSVRLLAESFDHYPAGVDPLHWVDTKRNNGFDDDQALFKTFKLDDQIVYGTRSEENNIHSHYVVPGVLEWTNYHYTGRMRMTEDDGDIGVTFFSRYPEQQDNYYRLCVTSSRRTFHIAPHPQEKRTVDQAKFDSGVKLRKNTWYRFHLEVEETGGRTTIRARVWVDGSAEPAEYQIDTFDDSPDRLRSGAVGVWSADEGHKYFDDLQVQTLSSSGLPSLRLGTPLLSENFDSYGSGQQPQGWVDTGENNSFTVDDTLFKTRRIKGNMAFGISIEKANVHSHYHAPDVLTWTNYAFHGRMYVDDREVAGVTFFSRFPEKRNDYYRLGTDRPRRTFHIATHPEQERQVDQAKFDSGLRPKSETWYRFYIEVEDDGQRTNIRAKIWEDGTPEPALFQIETFEAGAKRLRSGTVGVWSDRNGESYYDDLVVQPLLSAGLAFNTLFLDRKARAALGVEKLLAPGTWIALGAPRSVTIKPQQAGGPSYRWQRNTPFQISDHSLEHLRTLLQQGELSLLLLQADPAQWPKNLQAPPAFTCINGEINLDRLKPQSNSVDKLYTDVGLKQADLGVRPGPATLPGRLMVHSSGATLFGRIHLPWQPADQLFSAPFQLARLLAVTATNQPTFLSAYRLTVEVEHLTADERRTLVNAWRDLSTYLNPRNPLHGAGFEQAPTTVWTTLEITNPLDVPDLFWNITAWGTTPQLHIAPGELTLLLSDRQPYSQTLPPTTLATISPTDPIPLLVTSDGNTLQLPLTIGALATTSPRQISYRANLADQTEQVDFPPLELAFDPVETPRLLRNTLGLPTPEVIDGRSTIDSTNSTLVAQPLLWGFMPLADGWAQLPVPNLTEELYFQAQARPATQGDQASNEAEVGDPSTVSILRGTVALGNSNSDTLAQYSEEQAWNLTLTGVQSVNGVWTLTRLTDDQPFQLEKVVLTLGEPSIIANGFFWFSTERPSAADALPDLTNWVAGLVQIPLRSLNQLPQAFPPIVQIDFDAVTLSLRNQAEAPSARLDRWSLLYQIRQAALDQLGKVKQLVNGALQQHPPLVWRRHPALPMIQNLPLTQTLSPPNYPSASRQLAPYQLTVAPAAWKFGVPTGEAEESSAAAQWSQLLSDSEAAMEWRTRHDLSLAALSLPGLYFDPDTTLPLTGLEAVAQGWLPARYRYDLPYTDQLNALAQLPKEPRDPDQVSPLPDSPAPRPPAPIQRHTLTDHWQRLSEQASLASVAAADAWVKHAEQTTIQRLIEPLQWPVAVALDLTNYPGVIDLDNLTGQPTAPLRLTGTSALEGISGRFVEAADTSNTMLRTTDAAAVNPYLVRAGSMQSHVTGTMLRDQRGLQRDLTRVDVNNTNLMVTTVTLNGDHTLETKGARTYHLMSLRQSIQLDVPGAANWHFWCKDLPSEVTTEAAPTFDRNRLLSPVLKALEGETQPNNSIAAINDPEAWAREQNYRMGYEWRLGDKLGDTVTTAVQTIQPLHLNGLVFFPLTLEIVRFAPTGIAQLEIVGRLQLPLIDQAAQSEPELEDLSNAVRLIFTPKEATAPESDHDDTNAATLILTDIRLASSVVEWPLQVIAGEQSNAPRLEWHNIRLGTNQQIMIGTPIADTVAGAYCHFVLFNQEWRVPLGELVFGPAAASDPATPQIVTAEHRFALDHQLRTIIPQQLQVELNLTSGIHQAYLQVRVRAGLLSRPALDAVIQFQLVAAVETENDPENGTPGEPDTTVAQAPVTLTAATLFGKLALQSTDRVIQSAPDALQFVWDSCTMLNQTEVTAGQEQEIHFLPGMRVDPATCTGFMALTFVAESPEKSGTNPSLAGRIPTLRLTAGFGEALLACHWGEFLQTEPAAREQVEQSGQLAFKASPAQAFGASAGDLFIGYTTQWTESTVTPDLDGGQWDESFLLNGFLEVTNLISWPVTVTVDTAANQLTLPAIGDDVALSHLRHTIRVLLNQQELPSPILQVHPDGDGVPALFSLAPAQSWQFLAVVEHQLIKASLQAQSIDVGNPNLGLPDLFYQADRRWTVMQEVRLLLPATYAAFLADDGSQVIDPVAGIAPRWSLYGHYQRTWADHLTDPAAPDALHNLPADMLLIEASAPHWIRTRTVEAILRENTDNGQAIDPMSDTLLSGTTLQFLPSGSQAGILSSNVDYAPSAFTAPEWQLITMPFLGRLQVTDVTTSSPGAAALTAPHSFSVDPILQLWRLRQDAMPSRSPLLFMLTSWSHGAAKTLSLSLLDHAVSRTWSRLDPLSLEENWFRLQHPIPEPLARRVQSITAALPDTPARLSRATALQQAFSAFRPYYPPQLVRLTAGGNSLPASPGGPDLIWREESVMVWQSGSGAETDRTMIFPWLPIGVQLLTSPLFDALPMPLAVHHHAAATLLPAQLQVHKQANPLPVSFAVSPYLGLAYRPAPTEATLFVGSVELLGLDAASQQLRPVASLLREEQSVTSLTIWAGAWAEETRRRLRPDSPIGVVRLRLLFKRVQPTVEEDESGNAPPRPSRTIAPLIVKYAFTLVKEALNMLSLTQRVVALRSSIQELRFRDGHYGGAAMPTAVKVYELAPPLVTGVQPVYLTPQALTPSVEEQPSSADRRFAPDWPWGVSALTVGVQYTGGKPGVLSDQAKVGVTGRPPVAEALQATTMHTTTNSNATPLPATSLPYTLWWHAPQHQVQFRSAIADHGPTAGLPPRFRAQAIKSLLPVMPTLAFPTAGALQHSDPEDSLSAWQPLLPGALRYLLLGARPGAMLAMRNQLLRQRGLLFDPATSVNPASATTAPSAVDILVSGSVPVQHRVPRPVPLPENRADQPATALQTWSSYIRPRENVRAFRTPLDSVFFAECGDDHMVTRRTLKLLQAASLPAMVLSTLEAQLYRPFKSVADFLQAIALSQELQAAVLQTTQSSNQGLYLQLESPQGATVSSQWNGALSFAFELNDQFDDITDWAITLSVVDGSQRIAYEQQASTSANILAFAPKQPEHLTTLLAAKNAGEVIYVQVNSKPRSSTSSFHQTMTFPLRMFQEQQLRLPLEPRFTLFEDPEYNRRLASLAGRVSKPVQVLQNDELVLRTVTLATDRREYNVDSIVALRYDWDEPTLQSSKATVRFERVDRNKIPFKLTNPPDQDNPNANPANSRFNKLQTGDTDLLRFSLTDLRAEDPRNVTSFSPGDSLLIKLILEPGDERVKGLTEVQELVLTVNIIAEPVIPLPEAAYALLRSQVLGNESQVECVRFAWGPAADRIDMICPDDLLQEVVRRRAVFKWHDSVRPQPQIETAPPNTETEPPQYAVQKISQNGSTHFPIFK